MALRIRLSFLYTSLVGGVLLLFGVIVYLSASTILHNQVDRNLEQKANELINAVSWSSQEGLQVIIGSTMDIYIQVFNRDKKLVDTSPNIQQLAHPLYSEGMNSLNPEFVDVFIEQVHLRVLNVPMVIGDRLVGFLQLGSNLKAIDNVRMTLLTVLVVGTILSMSIAGLAGWFSIKHELRPLEIVTTTAMQITRADDLSRRIPPQPHAGSEVSQLIETFNLTLTRLEELFHSQRRIIADISHELRTPLTVIKGNVHLMQRMHVGDEESIHSILDEVERMRRLVEDLLLLAQAEAGKMPLNLKEIDLKTILVEVCQQMKILASDKVSLDFKPVDQVIVIADKDKIKQLFLNLVSNAILYSPKGSAVSINLGKDDQDALISVTDNGLGIPQEDLPHIFERFYRGEKARTRSRAGGGFGLGLSIAYWIVRNHGGDITVDSIPRKGTTFQITLPLPDRNDEEN